MRLLLLVLAASLAACGAPSPPPQTCAELHRICSLDDFGHLCGTCTGTTVCTDGGCATPPPPDFGCSGQQCGPGTSGLAGISCGTCANGWTCDSSGQCIAPACSNQAFAACTHADLSCCPTPGGVATVCTLRGATLAYCEPICTTTADCTQYNTSAQTWTCIARTDGVHVCAPQ